MSEIFDTLLPLSGDTERILLAKILLSLGGGGGGPSNPQPSIQSFSNRVNKAEIGSTVSSTILDWILGGGPITAQSIDHGIGSLAINLRTATDSASYTTQRTWTLSITDGTNSATAQTTVFFQNKIYWGLSANTSLNDAQVIALGSQFATTYLIKKTFFPAAQYIYFAFPDSFGTPIFIVNGLVNTAWTLVTRAFVNASGFSNTYRIYRSDFLLTGGPFIVELVAP